MNYTKDLAIVFGIISSFLFICSAVMGAGASHERVIYIGTYTDTGSKGIYTVRMNSVTGALSPAVLVATTPNPTFLDIDQHGKFLYAANEISNFEGKKSGAVSAFAIDRDTENLTLLNQVSTGGDGPCHVLLDHARRNVLAANYNGGSVVVLPIQADGKLSGASSFIQHEGKGINPERQEKAHAHCIMLDPANRFAFVCDLGIDKIMAYRFDSAQGKLTPNDPPFTNIKAGSGPRHLAFHPNGRFAYLINELSSTMTTLAYDSKHGSFQELQIVSTLPENFKGESTCAEVAVHPNGKFLYGSNRGDDSIVVYGIDPKSGTLTLVQRQSSLGKTPRHFVIDPTGKFLIAANQQSDNLVVFTLDPQTGRLQPAGQTQTVSAPVCLKFLP